MGRKPSELLLGGNFCEEFSMKPWNAMFGIFPRYHIAYHDSMRWLAIFRMFLNHLWKNFKSRSNLRCPPSVLGGWGPKFAMVSRVPHLQGTSRYFPTIFLKCSLCTHSSNLNLNGFS
jgi:hypothetical protein